MRVEEELQPQDDISHQKTPLMHANNTNNEEKLQILMRPNSLHDEDRQPSNAIATGSVEGESEGKRKGKSGDNMFSPVMCEYDIFCNGLLSLESDSDTCGKEEDLDALLSANKEIGMKGKLWTVWRKYETFLSTVRDNVSDIEKLTTKQMEGKQNAELIEEKLNRSKRDVIDLRKKVLEQEAEIESNLRAIQSTKDTIKQSKTEFVKAMNHFKACDADVEIISLSLHKVTNLEYDLEKKQAEIDDVKAESARYVSDYMSEMEKRILVESNNDDLREVVKKKELELEEKGNEISELTNENLSYKEAISELNQKLENARISIDYLTDEQKTLNEKIKHLESELEKIRQEFQTAEEALITKQQESNYLVSVSCELTKNMEEKTTRLEVCERESSLLLHKSVKDQNTISNLEEELAQTRTAMENIFKEMSNSREDVRAHTREQEVSSEKIISGLEDDLRSAEESVEKISEKTMKWQNDVIKKKSDQMEEMEKEMRQLKENALSDQRIINRLRGQEMTRTCGIFGLGRHRPQQITWVEEKESDIVESQKGERIGKE